MTFIDGQVLTASQLNDLASTDDLNTAVEAKVNEINGYDLTAKQSADTALSSSQTAQTAMSLAQTAASSAEAIADNSATYATTVLGLAGTTSGQYFRVSQGTDSYNAFIYYLNNAGVALAVAATVGAAAIQNALPTYNQLPSKMAFVVDSAGNVLLFTEDGLVGCPGFTPELIEFIFANSTEFTAVQNYAVDTVVSGVMIPVVQDTAGNVLIWADDGRTDFSCFGPEIMAYLTENLPFQPAAALPPVSDKTMLWRWRSKLAKINTGSSAYAKIGFTGDSWTEFPTIPQAMANIAYGTSSKAGAYAKAGDGMLQFGVDPGGPSASIGQQMNGIVIARLGWDTYDASATDSAPSYGCGADGMAIYTSSTTATLSYSNLTTSQITINYWDVAGAFRYNIDGGAWTTVTGGGTNVAKSAVISGLTLGVHTINIDTSVNTGVVSLLNLVSQGSGNGVEVNKLGNGAIRADGYTKIIPYIPYMAEQLDLDVLFFIIGTNDSQVDITIDFFKESLEGWVNAWAAACPNMAIILTVPSSGNYTQVLPFEDIKEAIVSVAQDNGWEYFNFNDFMPEWSNSNAAGMYYDIYHLNDVGANVFANLAYKNFIE